MDARSAATTPQAAVVHCMLRPSQLARCVHARCSGNAKD